MLKIQTDNNKITHITVKGVELGVGIVGYELRQKATEELILELYVNKSRVDLVVKELIKTKCEYIVENWIIEENARITVNF